MADEHHAATVIEVPEVVAPRGEHTLVCPDRAGDGGRVAAGGDRGQGQLRIHRGEHPADVREPRGLRDGGVSLGGLHLPVRVDALLLADRRVDVEAVDRRMRRRSRVLAALRTGRGHGGGCHGGRARVVRQPGSAQPDGAGAVAPRYRPVLHVLGRALPPGATPAVSVDSRNPAGAATPPVNRRCAGRQRQHADRQRRRSSHVRRFCIVPVKHHVCRAL